MNKPIIVIMLALLSVSVSCNKFPFDKEDPKPKTNEEKPIICEVTEIQTAIVDYSYSGKIEDGCGSVFTLTTKPDHDFVLIPKDETQVPEMYKNIQTFAPQAYELTYVVESKNPTWICGIAVDTKLAYIIRIIEMKPAICTDYPVSK